ncbi:MAG: FKBP-type peptidyl-prolyl cis-trans isomerase [Vicinamibacterales bacterium]
MIPRRCLFSFLFLAILAAGCDDRSTTGPSSSSEPGFTITELRIGTGAEAATGTTATITFTMWVFDEAAFQGKGPQADSGSLTFSVGTGEVIQGLSVGVRGMKVGGARRLLVPSRLAFGERGTTGVPANSPVVFDVELISVQ